MTGRIRRSYPVLLLEDEIVVAGKSITAKQIAEEYQPNIHQDVKLIGPPLLSYISYEVIDSSNAVCLVYHIVWSEEIHPKKLIHLLYRYLFFIQYYGSSKDCEFVEIWVNKEDGTIKKVKFETDNHVLVTLEAKINDTKQCSVKNNIELEVTTWNHMFRLYSGEKIQKQPPQLRYLSDIEYKLEKHGRRSHMPSGGHRTFKSQSWQVGRSFWVFLITILVLELIICLKWIVI